MTTVRVAWDSPAGPFLSGPLTEDEATSVVQSMLDNAQATNIRIVDEDDFFEED